MTENSGPAGQVDPGWPAGQDGPGWPAGQDGPGWVPRRGEPDWSGDPEHVPRAGYPRQAQPSPDQPADGDGYPPQYRPMPSTPGGGAVYGRPRPPAGPDAGASQGGATPSRSEPTAAVPAQAMPRAGTRAPAQPPLQSPAPERAWPPAPPGQRSGPPAPPAGRLSAPPSVSAPRAGGASTPPWVPAQPTGGVSAPPAYAPAGMPGRPPAPGGPPGWSPGPGGPVPTGLPPGGPPSSAGFPPGAVAPAAPGARPSRRWSRSALLLVVALVVLLVQSVLLVDMRLRLDGTRKSLSSGQRATGDRLNTLERRTGELEREAGRAFDPQAVATAVKPSVFRVEAGDYSGTAFAVGRGRSGTDLLTNFHVVEQVYKSNGRKVSLVRGDLRYSATIARVSKGHDLVVLHTTAKIPRLVPAKTPAASGQQIVVVGAPLGLEGSVTSGVISAIRTDLPSTQSAVVQFDAPINPGNSGGPVVDGRKQVVGIASAKIDAARGVGSVEGIGLAIPISVACKSFAGLC